MIATHFGHRRKRRRSCASLLSGLKAPLFLCLLMLFTMTNFASGNSFKAILATGTNKALTDRIKALTSAGAVYIPGKVEAGEPPKDRSFSKILAGEFREVSVEALYRFLDSMRETTQSLQLVPLWSHSTDCICMDHMNHDLLTDLVHYTRDNPKYGDSLLVKPGFGWAPPFHASYGTSLNRVRLYSHVYLGISLVILILSWSMLLMFLKHRHLKRKAAEAREKGEAVKEEEAAVPERPGSTASEFDVRRIDLL